MGAFSYHVRTLRAGEGSIKMRTYANRGKGGLSRYERSHTFFIQYLVHELLAIISRLFVSFIKMPALLCLFWFCMIKMDRCVISITRISIWICIKISKLTFLTTQISSFSQGTQHPRKYICSHETIIRIGITVRKSLLLCVTQLAGSVLLKKLIYFEIMLNIF